MEVKEGGVSEQSCKTLVIIPAYNEEANLGELLSDLKQKNGYFDILVVNDGSEDGTGEIAEAAGITKVINLPYNLGIGASVQTGFKFASENNYEFALQFDGDGQHKPEEICKLLEIVRSNEADVAIGSRFTKKHDGFKSDSFRRTGIRIFEWVSYLLIRQKITDHTSGFRAFNRRSIEFLKDNYPVDFPEPEVVILLGRNGFRMKEVFTQMLERKGGVSSISLSRGPYYMIKVLLSMVMAAMRSKKMD